MPKKEQFIPQRHVETPDRPEQSDAEPKQSEAKEALTHARKQYTEFKETFEPVINGYFGTESIQFSMEPGGWYIDLEDIKVNADPNFFLEKGYSESEALFATFHEAEHFRDMAQDHESYRRQFRRLRRESIKDPPYGKALKTLYNCLDDVLVNRSVMSRWRAGSKAKDTLYPKLFKRADLRGDPKRPQPRHRQFMYGLLREAMLPDEEIQVDPEVREAIDTWQARGGSRKTIDILTDVDQQGVARNKGTERFKIIAATAEPDFKKLFEQDLKDRKAKPKRGGGEPGEGKPGSSDQPFEEDPLADAIPDPIDYEDILDEINKINEAIAKKKGKEFEEAMGVSKEDFEAYQRDYVRVKPFIEELSEVFDQIIQRRISKRRVLRKPVKEGPMLDPRKAAIGVAEIKAGKTDPTIFLDYREQEVVREQPDQIEFTMVCDGSGSMKDNPKELMQRRLAVLFTEAFADFQDGIAKRARAGEQIKLNVLSEVRIFDNDDREVKSLSSELSHVDRVKMHSMLRNLREKQGNNEPATFEAIREEQFNAERIRKLRAGELKKVILFLTDGETNKDAVQTEIGKLNKLAGKTKQETSNFIVAGIGFEGGQSVEGTYAPNGEYVESLQDVPKTLKNFIKRILGDV